MTVRSAALFPLLPIRFDVSLPSTNGYADGRDQGRDRSPHFVDAGSTARTAIPAAAPRIEARGAEIQRLRTGRQSSRRDPARDRFSRGVNRAVARQSFNCSRNARSARDDGSCANTARWRSSGIAHASTMRFGDLSVRMRSDGQKPNGAEKQRPKYIPVDPEHRSHSRKRHQAKAPALHAPAAD